MALVCAAFRFIRRKHSRKLFYGRPPFRGHRLADGVLVGEHPDLPHCMVSIERLAPVDGDKVFASLLVIGELAVIPGLQHLKGGPTFDLEVPGWLPRASYSSHPHQSFRRNRHPNLGSLLQLMFQRAMRGAGQAN